MSYTKNIKRDNTTIKQDDKKHHQHLIYQKAIQEYFNVSEDCAFYMYFRFLRSKRRDNKYLYWNVRLQNALVQADKTPLDWIKLSFTDEDIVLMENGILIEEQTEKVFRHLNQSITNVNQSNEWIIVSNKKKRNKDTSIIMVKHLGMFI